MQLEKIAQQLKILGNPTRLAVFRQLVRFGPAGAPVGKVQEALNIAGSTLTNHLQKLASVGLAHQKRKGVEIICTANFEAMPKIIEFLDAECCADVEVKGEE